MRSTGEDGSPASEISNIRFLVGNQLRTIDDLDRRGLDAQAARELLTRLMRRHQDLRTRSTLPAAPGFGSVAG